jgi:hypothetical protein
VTSLSSPASIGAAAKKLGMIPADPNTTRYVQLHRTHPRVKFRP